MHSARTISARLSVASVAALTPLLGCGPDAEPSFGINGIAFDGERTITLSFSQSLANPDAIDPNDFRISYGATSSSPRIDPDTGEPYTKQVTIYRDLGKIYFYYDYDSYDPEKPVPFTFESVSREPAPNQLVLVGRNWDIESACRYVYRQREYYWEEGDTRDNGLFLHYAAGDIPLESADGEPLADIGAAWVLTSNLDRSTETYGFIELVPKWRIPCP